MVSEERISSLLPVAFQQSNLPLVGKRSGKVRDWYPLPEDTLASFRAKTQRLLITTDRLSAFDRVLASVPYKGQVLNQLASWWFEHTRDLIDNHLLSIPDPNAMVAEEVMPFQVEVVVRGYITGVTSTALWYRYSLGEREIYGYHFPEGLRKNERLSEPIITPTTKGGLSGHDERLTCSEVVEKGYLDKNTWEQVMSSALEIFQRGQEISEQSGMILVDTKYEYGRASDGRVLLIDEVHTPDSSRFWTCDTYEERFFRGEEPENFDKEFIRIAYTQRGYRGEGEPPPMEADLWVKASQRYIKIFENLTGQVFNPGEYPVEERLLQNLRKEGIIK